MTKGKEPEEDKVYLHMIFIYWTNKWVICTIYDLKNCLHWF